MQCVMTHRVKVVLAYATALDESTAIASSIYTNVGARRFITSDYRRGIRLFRKHHSFIDTETCKHCAKTKPSSLERGDKNDTHDWLLNCFFHSRESSILSILGILICEAWSEWLTELYSSYPDMYHSVCCGPYLLGPSSASSRKPVEQMTLFCKDDRPSCASNWLDDRTLVLSLQGLKITCTNDDVPFTSLPSHLVNSIDSPLGVLRREAVKGQCCSW